MTNMMNILFAIFLMFFAGAINGSFPLPIKYIDKWREENIWLQFSIWTYFLAPWIVIFFLVPNVLAIYARVPANLLHLIILGGFCFGIGQVCFSLALRMVGMGLGFIINIGLGMSLGFFIPFLLQHANQLFTPFGITICLGTLFTVIGLLASYQAGKMRDSEKVSSQNQPGCNLPGERYTYALGIILTVVAGLCSAGQNFTFAMTGAVQQLAMTMGATGLGAANIIWPLFLFCAFVPYAAYMLFLHKRNNSFGYYKVAGTAKYHLYAIYMAICWYGSLLIYGKASQLIGNLGPIVGWPLFMVMIILTSNFWGWRHKEWTGTSARVKKVLGFGLSFLILAVFILGYSTTFANS